MLQAALAEFPATGHVLNPIDWAEIELTKITDGGYLFANPQNDSQPRLWGLPVVETQAMTAGIFLTGAFRLGAQIFDRQDARVGDRKSDVKGKSVSVRVDLGGPRIIKTKKTDEQLI